MSLPPPRAYHSALHMPDSVQHWDENCLQGANIRVRCYCSTRRPKWDCQWCGGESNRPRTHDQRPLDASEQAAIRVPSADRPAAPSP